MTLAVRACFHPAEWIWFSALMKPITDQISTSFAEMKSHNLGTSTVFHCCLQTRIPVVSPAVSPLICWSQVFQFLTFDSRTPTCFLSCQSHFFAHWWAACLVFFHIGGLAFWLQDHFWLDFSNIWNHSLCYFVNLGELNTSVKKKIKILKIF